MPDSGDLHAADPFCRKTDFLCSAVRKVETAATDERTAIVDANINGAAVREIRDVHHRPEWECRRSGS
jgi:hypothetical protein